jgi:hypothetical protein
VNKHSLRRITFNGQTYLWSRVHRHFQRHEGCACFEVLTVYLEGYQKSFLKINFSGNENCQVGYPDNGVVSFADRPAIYNLNRPAVVKAIILHMLRNGWTPANSAQPCRIEDGLTLIDAAHLPAGN